ncbi:MAG TPA: Uma2 family endonuclease [Chitinophagaceae bacterium]|jgi:Uma2 family endonuclease|nr:Uma2 family endonuclease [Chitinophagaceae bacterium]
MENEVKEPAPKFNYITPEEYLEMEANSTEKHEYHRGEIFTMSGASIEHNIIAVNINGLAVNPLRKKGCMLFGSDYRVHIPLEQLFTYPDFSIVCGPVQESKYADNLINPSVIIEILSPSTKKYDRSGKFALYRSIRTLKEYLLIDSTSPWIELHTKQEDGRWILEEFRYSQERIHLSTVGITMCLKDIYQDISFAE